MGNIENVCRNARHVTQNAVDLLEKSSLRESMFPATTCTNMLPANQLSMPGNNHVPDKQISMNCKNMVPANQVSAAGPVLRQTSDSSWFQDNANAQQMLEYFLEKRKTYLDI